MEKNGLHLISKGTFYSNPLCLFCIYNKELILKKLKHSCIKHYMKVVVMQL